MWESGGKLSCLVIVSGLHRGLITQFTSITCPKILLLAIAKERSWTVCANGRQNTQSTNLKKKKKSRDYNCVPFQEYIKHSGTKCSGSFSLQTNVLCREISDILKPLDSRKSQCFGNYLEQHVISWELYPACHNPEKTWDVCTVHLRGIIWMEKNTSISGLAN